MISFLKRYLQPLPGNDDLTNQIEAVSQEL